jgi:hypothetical protein
VKSEWADFWVTIAMRFLGGILLGALAGVVLGHRIVLWWLSRDYMRWLGLWIGAWALGGGVIAVLRTPHWQTPWYKGITKSKDQILAPATADTATDVYGIESNDIDQARVALETVLGIQLEGRYSDYVGEHYRGILPSGVSLQLRRNEDPVRGEQSDPPRELHAEPEFAPFPILLYVSGNALYELRTIIEGVPGVRFLQRRAFAGS